MYKALKVLIFEDEEAAARSLIKAIRKIMPEPKLELLAVLESVKEGLAFFENEAEPDLIFMDIQLSDGLAFDLFDFHRPTCPIIFTTAYSEYAIKAFEVNGLHYLLKPIQDKELEAAFDRFEKSRKEAQPGVALDHLLQEFRKAKNKENFLVYAGESMRLIPTEDIALFYVQDKGVWLQTLDSQNYRLSQRLDDIQQDLDPERFYRANRQMLVQKKAILKIDLYFNQKLLVQIKPDPELRVVISKEKASDFKAWLEK